MRIGTVNQTLRNQYQANRMQQTQKQKQSVSQKLSSGQKVNRAADNAAALAISEKMMKQLRTLNQGSLNIDAGIHVNNIADSAISSVSDSLIDMEVNALRAMNGTMSESDRNIIQQDIDASAETINDTANNAQYNEMKLLDGSTPNISIADGSSQNISLTTGNMTSASLGVKGFSVTGDSISTDSLDSAFQSVSRTRSVLGAQTNRLSSAKRSNDITAENTAASYSRMRDTDMAEAISRYKQLSTVESVQTRLLQKQLQDGTLVTKMF